MIGAICGGHAKATEASSAICILSALPARILQNSEIFARLGQALVNVDKSVTSLGQNSVTGLHTQICLLCMQVMQAIPAYHIENNI